MNKKELKDFNKAEFLEDLKALLIKHDVVLGTNYDHCSDMHGVYDLRISVFIKDSPNHKWHEKEVIAFHCGVDVEEIENLKNKKETRK